MLEQQVDAIYENGVLRPLRPLELAEHQHVSLIIGTNGVAAQEAQDPTDYLPLIAEEGDLSITWDQVQAVLVKLPDSLADDFDRERNERF